MDAIAPINAVAQEPLESLKALERLQRSASKSNTTQESPAQQQKERAKAAKQFESVLLTQLLNEMKNTIGQWGPQKDGAAQQVDSMFWSTLGQDLGQQGGLGLWKQIDRHLSGQETSPTTPPTWKETA